MTISATPLTTPEEAALSYLRRGWGVLPIVAGDKKPCVPWKEYETRRATEEEVRGWYKRWPDAGVGIIAGAVSGLVVFDRDGEKGLENLRARGVTAYPDTPRASTRRGEHVFFQHPGFPVSSQTHTEGNAEKGLIPWDRVGLEWKGDGGYVVAAPTMHADGTVRYAWEVSPKEAELAELPDWFWKLYAEAKADGDGATVEVHPVDLAAAEDYVPEDMGGDSLANAHDEEHDDTPAVRPLTDFLAALDTERAPGEAGGVPVPEAWECVRAVLGGASRKDLEDAHAPAPGVGTDLRGKEAEERVSNRAKDGTHLPPGLHIVTGQTGGGKSALAMNLAHAAIGAGHPVLYVSLELDGGEIAARLLSLETALPWNLLALHRALNNPGDRAKRAAGIAALTERAARFAVLAPVQPLPRASIRAAAVTLWREHGGEKAPLVIFDYLQAAAMLDAGARGLPLREHIGAVTMELRALSRERTADGWRGCPVVVLSTTARSNVKGDSAAPGMDGTAPDKLRSADLETLKALPKEAGEVEATAVTAWVVALGEKEENSGARRLTLRLVKNRLGPPGQWIPFAFHGATGKLEEVPERFATAPEEEARVRAESDEAKPNGRKRPAVSGPPTEEEAF